MVKIKFVYYKLKKLLISFYNITININRCVDVIALYCKIKANKHLSFISFL